jgi:glycosyltransferase involved in cell wall biosynthesis
LHSTGLPDHVEFSNRLLSPLTDAFIAVAESHGCYLAAHEGCPAKKICVIPNGVDVERFHPRWPDRALQQELGLDAKAPVVGIVAALRPEKNHELFLQMAALVRMKLPAAQFLVVGDGPQRAKLEGLAESLKIAPAVHFAGTRSDVPELLSLMDVLALTSHMEANPICLLEAMASEKPVVATRVGSVTETVLEGRTGFLAPAGNSQALADRVLELLTDRTRATTIGRAGREHVIAHWSVDRMVQGYQDLLTRIYTDKCTAAGRKSQDFVVRVQHSLEPEPQNP